MLSSERPFFNVQLNFVTVPTVRIMINLAVSLISGALLPSRAGGACLP